ncbi:unannotated protein [freshwater metagenome]|uniref:Unannotated protein n=1 Tax=freshwater metagenome TaxID=449393 RepID=A0A6J6SZ91_9ZZZZ
MNSRIALPLSSLAKPTKREKRVKRMKRERRVKCERRVKRERRAWALVFVNCDSVY